MSPNRLHLSIAAGIVAVSVLECVRAYSELPDPMASNFGGDGAPGGWSSKKSFIVVYALSMAFWFGGIVATPFLASRARQNFDDVTRLWLRDTIGWFLLASLAFSALVTHLVLEANLVTGKLSTAFVWCLGVYMAYMVWWTVRLVRRVKKFPSKR